MMFSPATGALAVLPFAGAKAADDESAARTPGESERCCACAEVELAL